ncbi:MAG: hypothetical protein CMO49_01280 [Verrucomicrobiales bacterium]|nr:hypothetical protein [Verrucomicrobiales bacterium]|tara:strand:- start:19953 stop:20828 length:876 start_codon:yes stop_codon:yes gene_type:complete
MSDVLISRYGAGFLALKVKNQSVEDVLVFGPTIPFSYVGCTVDGKVQSKSPDGKSLNVDCAGVASAILVEIGKHKICVGDTVRVRITHDASLVEPHKGHKGRIVSSSVALTERSDWLTGVVNMCKNASKIVLNDAVLAQKLTKNDLKNVNFKHSETIFDDAGYGDFVESLMDASWLLDESGGSITLDRSKVAWCFDVNTSSVETVSRSRVKKVNHEAWNLINRKIVLLNLSGLILIDFIEMSRTETDHLLEQIKKDQTLLGIQCLGRTRAGLIEITRKRHGYPLWDLLKIC